MNQPDLNLDLCTIEAFGRMCVLPDEVVAEPEHCRYLPARSAVVRIGGKRACRCVEARELDDGREVLAIEWVTRAVKCLILSVWASGELSPFWRASVGEIFWLILVLLRLSTISLWTVVVCAG